MKATRQRTAGTPSNTCGEVANNVAVFTDGDFWESRQMLTAATKVVGPCANAPMVMLIAAAVVSVADAPVCFTLRSMVVPMVPAGPANAPDKVLKRFSTTKMIILHFQVVPPPRVF